MKKIIAVLSVLLAVVGYLYLSQIQSMKELKREVVATEKQVNQTDKTTDEKKETSKPNSKEKEVDSLNETLIQDFYDYPDAKTRNQNLKKIMTKEAYEKFTLPEDESKQQASKDRMLIKSKKSYSLKIDEDNYQLMNLLSASVNNVPYDMLVFVAIYNEDGTYKVSDVTFRILQPTYKELD